MSNYDIHLFIQQAAAQAEEVSVIPQNKEKYITFMAKIAVDDGNNDGEEEEKEEDVDAVNDANDEDTNSVSTNIEKGGEVKRERKKHITLRFLDSYRFMAHSLEDLASYLEEIQFIETRRAFHNDEEFKLVTRKGVFPYEFIDSYEKLQSTKELPSQHDFYSALTETAIDQEQYEHAREVWRTFNCSTLADYSDLYLKTDVLLLVDVFEAFRTVCMEIYGLEACSFITIPGLSWQAMLKYTKVIFFYSTFYILLLFIVFIATIFYN